MADKPLSRWQLFLYNKHHWKVVFILLIMTGITVQRESVFGPNALADPAYWGAMVFFGLLILLIIGGNEWHYRELNDDKHS